MKMNRFFLMIGILTAFFVAGCSKEEKAQVTADVVSPEVKPAAQAAVDPATAGSVSGAVKFEGVPPVPEKISVQGNPECAVLHPGGTIQSEEIVSENGMLQNVVVYVKEGLEGYAFTPSANPVRIDNNQCTYKPHVSAVQVGQPVELYNSDATLHNMHSYSTANKSFNVGLPIQGMKQVKKFSSAELPVTIKCDVHPWMKGYLAVLPHPYFAVTGADGRFEIKNLPPGEYLLEAWHEKLGVQSQKIKIEPQSAQTAEFTFKG